MPQHNIVHSNPPQPEDPFVSSDPNDEPFRSPSSDSCNIDLGSSSILDGVAKDTFCPNREDNGSFEFACDACWDRRLPRARMTEPRPDPRAPDISADPLGEKVPFRTRRRTTRFVLQVSVSKEVRARER